MKLIRIRSLNTGKDSSESIFAVVFTSVYWTDTAIALIKESHPRYQEVVRNYLIVHIIKQDSMGFAENLNLL